VEGNSIHSKQQYYSTLWFQHLDKTGEITKKKNYFEKKTNAKKKGLACSSEGTNNLLIINKNKS
jgi:hypothetical protein